MTDVLPTPTTKRRDARWGVLRCALARPYIGIVTIILLVAAAVRLHNLGVQSFWYDEGVAFAHSQRTLSQIIPALQNNVHVPAYFGLLALYEDFVGSSEFALRSLSAFFSVLSVAFTYALGRRLFGVIAGVAAAAFVALNTFSIYYAQEARMYAMLSAVGVASMWVFVGFVRGQTLNRGLALGLLNTLGIYTHYSYALVMLAQGTLALIWLLTWAYQDVIAPEQGESRLMPVLRGFVAYTAANLLTLLLFLPWLPIALRQVSAQPNVSQPVPLPQLLNTLFGWLALGRTYTEVLGGMGIAVYFFLIFGLLLLPDQRRQRAWWALLLPVVWVLISLGAYLYLELYERYLRFLLPAQIAVALWMGRGLWVIWHLRTRETQTRLVPKVVAVLVGLAFTWTLARGVPPLYADAAYQRHDYRGLAATITREADENDAVVLTAPGLAEIFGYYYEGVAPVYPLPGAGDARADVLEIVQASERVFAVYYGTGEQDPDSTVEGTLSRAAYQISDVWVDDMRFVRYATPAEFDADDAQTVNAQFGEHITLTRYTLNTDQLQPNDLLQLQLQWTTDAALATRYKVFVQLLAADGVLVAQRDSIPAGGQAPTTSWRLGATVIDNHALSIPDLAAGAYTLIVGLYDANDPQARLTVQRVGAATDERVTAGDYLELAVLQVGVAER